MMCILLATALTTSMLSETPFLSRSVHSPMSYPTKKLFDSTKMPISLCSATSEEKPAVCSSSPFSVKTLSFSHRDEAFCRHITVSACPAYGCGGGTNELCALHHARPARSIPTPTAQTTLYATWIWMGQ